MSPTSTIRDRAYVLAARREVPSDSRLAVTVCQSPPNGRHFYSRELRRMPSFTDVLSAVSPLIKNIGASVIPSKIRKAIVSVVAILVARLVAMRRWTNECLKNKSMNKPRPMVTFWIREAHRQIARSTDWTWCQLSPRLSEAFRAPYSLAAVAVARISDGVTGEAFNVLDRCASDGRQWRHGARGLYPQ